MTTLEKEIEAKLRKAVEKRGGRCLKWVCPGWSGVPDRIVLLPGGRIHFVETKRPKGGKVSALQNKWRAWLHELGFSYWIIWDDFDLHVFELTALTTYQKEYNHETDQHKRDTPHSTAGG